MKKLYFTFILLSLVLKTYSQSCHGVKELLRKRHTVSGMTYGNPYTMFVKEDKFDLQKKY